MEWNGTRKQQKNYGNWATKEQAVFCATHICCSFGYNLDFGNKFNEWRREKKKKKIKEMCT